MTKTRYAVKHSIFNRALSGLLQK